jgi:hypothetical protein
MGDRYEMKHKCAFVDAQEARETEHQKGPKKPDGVNAAHVYFHEGNDKKVLKLNDTAGFIARFIVQGVEIDQIPEILKSEYGSSIGNAAQEVDTVLGILNPYVQKRTGTKPFSSPQSQGIAEAPATYDLDFKLNWFAVGWIKF